MSPSSKAYAGIGSRETPEDILAWMTTIASHLDEEGWTLRSGGAPGADSAFELGAARKEIYLPWRGFEGRTDVVRTEPQAEAYDIAAQFHPRWQYLKQGAKKLHARNVHQVLGPDVTNPTLSEFIICWTVDAKGGGGTGQALRIASAYEVSIYDLASPRDTKLLDDEVL